MHSSRRRSAGPEVVYVERDREREREKRSSRRLTEAPKEEYATYQYVEPPRETKFLQEAPRKKSVGFLEGGGSRTSAISVGRERERERVLVEEGGRRREYYRRG